MSTRQRAQRGTTTGVALLILSVVAALFAVPTSAFAAPGAIQQPGPTSVTADALPTSQVNGVVWSQVIVGNTVFAGGQFTSVRPAGAAPGTAESRRSNLMSYDIRTGQHSTFAPVFNGPINIVKVSADLKTLYVGGAFTAVNNQRRYRFAAFTIATGALTPLAPLPNNTVNAIAVIGTNVYLGGAFNKVNGVSRNRLVSFSATTGKLWAWAPAADATIQAMVPTPDQTRVVVAGSLTKLGTTAALGMGSLDARTGVVRPWLINTIVKNAGTNASILTLSADKDTIYGGGYAYGTVPGATPGNFEGAFAANPTTGAVKWLQDCHGDTYDIAPIGNIVYSVGHSHYCKNIGAFPDTSPRTDYYHALAATKSATGTVAKNGQAGSAYGNFEGQPAPSLYNWFPRINVGTFTTLNQGAWSITGNTEYISLGGEFTQVNDRGQQGLVRMAIPSRSVNKMGPVDYDFNPQTVHTPTSPSSPPTVTPVPDQGNVVSWKANWDRDDQVLDYDVVRAGVVIGTVRATSQFWNRPKLGFTDATGVAGRSYTYKIVVRDPDGNTRTSPVTSAVAPSRTDYARLVQADGATHQWRLGSSTGPSTPDAVGGTPLTVGAGVALTTPGAFAADADTAGSLDGSAAASAQTERTVLPSDALSIEAWFKTTSRTGGALVGFGSTDPATPPVSDRRVFLRADGRLSFAVQDDGLPPAVATTDSAYNDGAWHQLVATQSADGLQLFVDGARMAATIAGAPSGAPQSGSWGVGGPTSSSLPGAPEGTYAGALDDVSVVGAALTTRQVRDHFTAGQPRYNLVLRTGSTRTVR